MLMFPCIAQRRERNGTKADLQHKCNTVKNKKPVNQSINRLLCGMDGYATKLCLFAVFQLLNPFILL